MNLSGGKQGPQSSTIYGYREEYKPSQKTDARSMVRGGLLGAHWCTAGPALYWWAWLGKPNENAHSQLAAVADCHAGACTRHHLRQQL